MGFESAPTIEESESLEAELMDAAMPLRKAAAESIFNMVDGGIQNTKYLNREEKDQVRNLVNEYAELTTSLDPKLRPRRQSIIAEVKNLVDEAFDRENS